MNISKEARDIHYSALVVDTHSDSLAWPTRHDVDIGQRQEETHMDLPRMKEGNQNVQFFACFASPGWIEKKKVVQVTLDYMDSFHTLMQNYPEQIEQATTADDVRRITDAGKLAGILCIEGGHSIDDDLSILRMYHRLGARYMTLTWNNTNNWADGVLDEPRHEGLNHFGREVVREMNRLGMLVDISHVAPATFWDAIATTTKPVIASHSSAKAICAAPRNLEDDQIRAVADNGGVIGVNYEITFVGEAYRIAKDTVDEEKADESKRAEKDHPAESGRPQERPARNRREPRRKGRRTVETPLHRDSRPHRPHGLRRGRQPRRAWIGLRRRDHAGGDGGLHESPSDYR